jgi:cytochrome c
MVVSPTGDLYALEYGSNWFSQNMDARLIHITYSSANRVPLAVIQTDKTIGKTPFNVSFNGEGSRDFDGDELSFAWDFGDGTKSTEKNPVYTYQKPGRYKVSLTVKDPSGEASTSETTVIAGNDLPEVTLRVKGNSQFFFDKESISYEVDVNDSEDGKLNQGIPANAVTVTVDYLARGHDITEIAQGHEASVAASAHLVGRSLTENSDCGACHQLSQQSVGPAYIAMADRYVNATEKTIRGLAEKIIKGGSGEWGELMMSPHPQLSVNEAEKMVKYILSLNGKTITAGLPTSGTIRFDKHKPGEQEGKYIITASYSDKGGNGIQSLTKTAMLSLSYPIISAENYSKTKKTMAFNIKAEEYPIVDKDMNVILPSHEGMLRYNQIDLTGIRVLKLIVGVAPNYFSGGKVEVYIGGDNPRKIAEANLEIGLTSMGMKEIYIELDELSGKHDLEFRFLCKDTSKIFAAMAAIELLKKK